MKHHLTILTGASAFNQCFLLTTRWHSYFFKKPHMLYFQHKPRFLRRNTGKYLAVRKFRETVDAHQSSWMPFCLHVQMFRCVSGSSKVHGISETLLSSSGYKTLALSLDCVLWPDRKVMNFLFSYNPVMWRLHMWTLWIRFTQFII